MSLPSPVHFVHRSKPTPSSASNDLGCPKTKQHHTEIAHTWSVDDPPEQRFLSEPVSQPLPRGANTAFSDAVKHLIFNSTTRSSRDLYRDTETIFGRRQTN